MKNCIHFFGQNKLNRSFQIDLYDLELILVGILKMQFFDFPRFFLKCKEKLIKIMNEYHKMKNSIILNFAQNRFLKATISF